MPNDSNKNKLVTIDLAENNSLSIKEYLPKAVWRDLHRDGHTDRIGGKWRYKISAIEALIDLGYQVAMTERASRAVYGDDEPAELEPLEPLEPAGESDEGVIAMPAAQLPDGTIYIGEDAEQVGSSSHDRAPRAVSAAGRVPFHSQEPRAHRRRSDPKNELHELGANDANDDGAIEMPDGVTVVDLDQDGDEVPDLGRVREQLLNPGNVPLTRDHFDPVVKVPTYAHMDDGEQIPMDRHVLYNPRTEEFLGRYHYRTYDRDERGRILKGSDGKPKIIEAVRGTPSSVTKDHTMIPHYDVVLAVEQSMFDLGVQWQNTEILTTQNQERMYAKWTIAKIDASGERKKGDILEVGIKFRSSLDGTMGIHGDVFATRVACSNGMIVTRLLGKLIKRRHTKYVTDTLEQVPMMIRQIVPKIGMIAEHTSRAMIHTMEVVPTVKGLNLPQKYAHMVLLRMGIPHTYSRRKVDWKALEKTDHAKTVMPAWDIYNAVTWCATHKAKPHVNEDGYHSMLETAQNKILCVVPSA